MNGSAPTPFSGEPPRTIALHPPPLAIVLTQVRFSETPELLSEQALVAIDERLRDLFPVISREKEVVWPLGPDVVGKSGPDEFSVRRLASKDGDLRAGIGSNFVSLETSRYSTHQEFFGAFRRLLDAVAAHAEPQRVERLGVRYVNQVTEESLLEDLPDLVRPEALGVTSLSDEGVCADHVLTQALFTLGKIQLAARWGVLPGGTTTDPSVPARDSRAWTLDIDVFDGYLRPFSPADLESEAIAYSRRQYQFFRWAVTPRFLEVFGASSEDLGRLEKEVAR